MQRGRGETQTMQGMGWVGAVRVLAVAAVLAGCAGAERPARAESVQAETQAIVAMLQRSAEDWNRGDLKAFASCYKDSPEILFMGAEIRRGFKEMLEGYQHSYPTRDSMGQLSFTRLEVEPLDPHFATVTGRFHLQRSAGGGGDADGFFLLVVEKTSGGWKIVRDDTTPLPRPEPGP